MKIEGNIVFEVSYVLLLKKLNTEPAVSVYCVLLILVLYICASATWPTEVSVLIISENILSKDKSGFQ